MYIQLVEQLVHSRLEPWGELEDRDEELRSVWSLGVDPIPCMCDLLYRWNQSAERRSIPHINGLACQAQVQDDRH